MIRSRSNPRVKALAALKRGKERLATGLALAEGVHLTQEAFASPIEVQTLVLAESAMGREDVGPLREAAASQGVEILPMDDSCFQKVSDLRSPEGVAVVVRPGNVPLADVLHSDVRLAVVVGVQDPGNAGAVVRTAEAAGASGCVLVESVDPTGPKFLRATMGSAFRLPCAVAGQDSFLSASAAQGVHLLVALSGAARDASCIDFTRADYSSPVAVCVGAEGSGVPDAMCAAAAQRLIIPMAGAVESLNVAVAAGLLLYEAQRYWGLTKPHFAARRPGRP